VGHRWCQPQRPSPPAAHPRAVEATGLHHDIGTLRLDRGYDYPKTRAELADRGLTDLDIQRRGTKAPPGPHRPTLGLRWVVQATNTILIVGRLIDWRNRWNPT
jgi:hypothetical protein